MRLALVLVALLALPAAATAQGARGPGEDPARAGDVGGDAPAHAASDDGASDEATDGASDEATDGASDEATDDGASDEAADDAASDEAADDGASDEAADDGASDEAADDGASDDPTEPQPRRRASREPDANVPSTGASGVLGVVTILATVGMVAGIGMWVEREDNVARCAAYDLEEPRYRGCLNVGAIRDQRDVGMGLTLGFGALAIGAAVAWGIVAASTPAAAERAVTCAPGVLSFGCAGRF